MFKLVVLSCLVSVAFAGVVHAPIEYAAQVKHYVEPQVSIVETPTVEHVGSVVKNVPTGVSHHSSSVVHSHASIVEPVYAHGVDKKIVSTPVVKNYVEQVYAEPIVAKAAYVHAPVAYAPAPVAYAPAAYSQAVYAPKALSYASYPAAHAAYPAAYSAYPAVSHSSYSAYPAVAHAAYPAVAHSAYSALPYAHHY